MKSNLRNAAACSDFLKMPEGARYIQYNPPRVDSLEPRLGLDSEITSVRITGAHFGMNSNKVSGYYLCPKYWAAFYCGPFTRLTLL